MGLNYNDVRSLLEWRRNGSGGKVVTLGHLNVALHPSELAWLRRELAEDRPALEWLDRYRWGEHADDMFRSLFKFQEIESLDFSPYEGATIVQDIGAPLRSGLAGQFDLAVDGGTLEHVFNFPTAIGNLMRLVKVGGAVYTQSPCNSLAGHGFYQFSPELMYRVLSEANGFEISFVRIAIARNLSIEQTAGHQVYEVVDPTEYGGRVMLSSRSPAIMMSLAIKRSDVEPFREPVLQSDYVRKWAGENPVRLNWKGQLIDHMGKSFPLLQSLVAGFRERRQASVQNARAYRRIW
jgi:hypothetical protein